MDVEAAVGGDGGGGREIIMYVLWGGMVQGGGDGNVMYEGGSRKCVMLKEAMGVEEVRGMVKETTEVELSDKKLWYTLKYDRQMLLNLEGDNDVRMVFKGNDEHGNLYVTEKEGPVRRADDGGGRWGRRVRPCYDGTASAGVHASDGDGAYVSVGGWGAEVRGTRAFGNSEGQHAPCRGREGGNAVEFSDDDEVSVASEDVGDEEGEEVRSLGEVQATEGGWDERTLRRGWEAGEDVNDKVWLRSGVQARSYHQRLSIWK